MKHTTFLLNFAKPICYVLVFVIASVGFHSCTNKDISTEVQPNTAKVNGASQNATSSIFDELRLAEEAYIAVLNAKYVSIQNNETQVQQFLKSLNSYAQMRTEEINLASFAVTLGFENENAYNASSKRIQNAILAIKNANNQLSDSALLELIKDELDWHILVLKVQGGCRDTYDAEITAHFTTALVGLAACGLGSLACGPFAPGCAAACGATVAANQYAQSNVSLLKYRNCKD